MDLRSGSRSSPGPAVSLGTIETQALLHSLGTRYNVDGLSVVSRLDGFYSVRFHLGIGPGIFALVLDSTVPGRWHLLFPGIMTCEDEDDPELLSTDAVFACPGIEVVPDASIPLTVAPGAALEPGRAIDRIRLRAAWDPVSFLLSLDAGDARLEIDRRARWTLRAHGREPIEDVRFAAEFRVWGG